MDIKQQNVNLPIVGVIIPNHNMEDSILDALNSVIEQDYPQKVMMIVDDCSTDNSWNKLREYLDDSECHLNENNQEILSGIKNQVMVHGIKLASKVGPASAKNIGMQAISSLANIFGFLDADDTYCQGKISKSVIEFLENPEIIGVVYSDHSVSLNGANFVQYLRSFSRSEIYNVYYGHISFFISAILLNKIGGFDQNLPIFENYDLILRAAEQSVLIHIPEPLSNISIRSDSLLQKPTHNPNAVLQYIINKSQHRQSIVNKS